MLADQTHQIAEIRDKGLRDDTFDTLPDKLDRIQIGRIWWQIDQLNATFSCTRFGQLRMMRHEIIENHDNPPFRIERTYRLQKFTHRFFPRVAFEVNN